MANNGILIVAVSSRGSLPPAAYELVTAGRALADALKQPLSAVVLPEKAGALAPEGFGGCHKRGNRGFPVGCASSIQAPIANRRQEGVRLPLIERTRRHDIRMPGEAKKRVGAAAPCPEIAHSSAADVCTSESRSRQP